VPSHELTQVASVCTLLVRFKGRLLTFVVTKRQGKVRFVTAHPMHNKQREIYREEE